MAFGEDEIVGISFVCPSDGFGRVAKVEKKEIGGKPFSAVTIVWEGGNRVVWLSEYYKGYRPQKGDRVRFEGYVVDGDKGLKLSARDCQVEGMRSPGQGNVEQLLDQERMRTAAPTATPVKKSVFGTQA